MNVFLVVNFTSAQDLPDGCIAYYSFNSDANNQVAGVGHGTVVDAVLTIDRNGNPNSAYLFSGERGIYIEISNDLVLPIEDEPRTLAAWVRCDDSFLEDEYQLPEKTNVSLRIFDINGQEVAFLVNDVQSQGNYRVRFDGHHLSSGIYIYQLKTNAHSLYKRMLFLK